MGIKPHTAREREATRRVILRAARQLFLREGYSNVSMRKIAERTEYSAAAIYLYFADKADLFYALAEEGFRRFSVALSAPYGGEDALATLEERCWRYFEFSKKHPEYFWLMFVDRSVPRLSKDWESLEVVKRARVEGIGMVQRCVDAGLFPRGTSPAAAFQVLSTATHGAAVSRLCGRSCHRRDADALARDTLRTAIAGLRAGVALSFPARADLLTRPWR